MKYCIEQFKQKIIKMTFITHEFRKFKSFPDACCVLSSHLLARFLIREHSYTNVEIVHGERPNYSWHYWVEVDGKVVDITMQQFEIEDVILDYSLWHSECKILERWSVNYEFEDVDEGADSSSCIALEEAYQSIINT